MLGLGKIPADTKVFPATEDETRDLAEVHRF
jgi:hypothetical protein